VKTTAITQNLRICFALTLIFVGTASGAQQQKVLSIDDAMKTLNFTTFSVLNLSPDGVWVAYSVQDDSRRKTYSNPRYQMYGPTGSAVRFAGSDVWITNTKTRESRNLTGGHGASWAPVWSPDGKYIAFFSDRGGTANLWLWEKQTGQIRALSDLIIRPGLATECPHWSPDSTHVLVRTLPAVVTVEQDLDRIYGPAAKLDTPSVHDPNSTTVTVLKFDPAEIKEPLSRDTSMTTEIMKYMLADLTLIDVRSGKADLLVSGTQAFGYWFSPDGKQLVWTNLKEQRPNTCNYELRLFNLVDRSSSTVVSSLDQLSGLSVSWSPDSKLLAYTTDGDASLAKGDIYVVSAGGGEPRLLTPGDHPPFESFLGPLWDKRGENLYLVSSNYVNMRGSGQPSVWKASVPQAKLSKLADIPNHIIRDMVSSSSGGQFWSPDGGKSLVVIARDETTKQDGFFKVDLTDGRASRLYEVNEFIGDNDLLRADVTPDGKTLVFTAQDAQHPEDIWMSDDDFHDPQRISSINGKLEGIAFGKSELIDYYSDDGEHLHGALLLPSNYQQGKKYPLIVYPYAGSSLSKFLYRFGLEGTGAENMQILATRGYAILLPDTPLHTNNHMSEIAKLILPAVDRVVEMGIADPNRLGIMGHSYGGYSTLAVIVQSTRFKAAIDRAGPSDLVSGYGQMNAAGMPLNTDWSETGQGGLGGTLWQNRDRYIENSPVFYLDRVQTPLLIVHGASDSRVINEQMDEVFVDLRRLGKEVSYANYGGEEHVEQEWGIANQKDYWNRVIDWFDTHLQPVSRTR